jgi:putative ABC transport system permease protein
MLMFWNAILLALREIRRNVLRSSLTILGIVIGVAAVITMVTIGQGATAQVQADIGKLGTNLLQVFRGQGFGGGGGARSSAPPFTMDDATAIESELSGVEAVAPSSNASAQAIYGNTNWFTSITGSTDKFLEVRDWTLSSGRNFSESELRGGAAVCLLGNTVKQELFGAEDPVGITIRLGKLACQVIGTLGAKGQSGFGQDQDDLVVIPLRTLQRRMAGNSDVGAILVSARDGVSTEKVQADIERLLRERRKVRAGGEDDFNVRDLKEVASAFTSSTRVLTALLGAVAAVSLIVGGVGIMNIMLVSVTERTREIGTRLAVGAMARDVLLQFLVEAVVLAALGGVIGILLGLGAAALATSAFKIPFVLNLTIVALSFAFSAAVGIVFGYFPAQRAAQLDPIEALRHE